jgi:hypothetical protein
MHAETQVLHVTAHTASTHQRLLRAEDEGYNLSLLGPPITKADSPTQHMNNNNNNNENKVTMLCNQQEKLKEPSVTINGTS